MIIDSHAHVAPHYDRLQDWDFDNLEDLWAYHQSTNYFHHKPVATTSRGERSDDAWKLLWDERNAHSWSGRTDVGFRISGDQFVWEKGGVTYSAPLRPGTDAARLIELMDSVGVDKAVLQATLSYNRYFGRITREYPGRFLPLALLDDDGDAEAAIAGMAKAVDDGCAGIYQNPLPGWVGYEAFHTPRFDPVWREVERRKLPVYTMGFVTGAAFVSTLPKLRAWCERFPTIKRVVVHGLPQELLLADGQYCVPDHVRGLVNDYDLLLELLPLAHSLYLHPRTDEMIKALFDTFGPTRFCWGTEFIKSAPPHTPEHYAELKGYFASRCVYMSPEDIALILGGNLQRVFHVA